MRSWRRRLVAVVAAVVILAPLASETLVRLTTLAQRTGSMVGQNANVPRPVLLAVVMVLLLVVSFGVIFGLVRVFTSVGTTSGERLARVYDRVTPDSPQTKALAFMIAFVVVFLAGLGAFTPWFASTLAEDTGVDGVVGDIQDARYAGKIPELFEDDAVESDSQTVETVGPNATDTDTDGDGLPDAWEQAGETPSGARLPDASPDHMDLYVQLNYGPNVTTLTASDRQQLQSVWRTLPVDNPDGVGGVDLHIVDSGDRAGRISESVELGSGRNVDRFYTRERLGDRYCSYHQVVLADVGSTGTIGYSETPGYASVADGGQFSDYGGSVTFRAATVTHLLLHNVVGPVDGSVHTAGGWLDYPSPDNEQLTQSARNRLGDGFVTTQAYRDECA